MPRSVLLPLWFIVLLSLGGGGAYFGYRAPAIIAALVIRTVLVVGVVGYLTETVDETFSE